MRQTLAADVTFIADVPDEIDVADKTDGIDVTDVTNQYDVLHATHETILYRMKLMYPIRPM